MATCPRSTSLAAVGPRWQKKPGNWASKTLQSLQDVNKTHHNITTPSSLVNEEDSYTSTKVITFKCDDIAISVTVRRNSPAGNIPPVPPVPKWFSKVWLIDVYLHPKVMWIPNVQVGNPARWKLFGRYAHSHARRGSYQVSCHGMVWCTMHVINSV